MLALCSTLFGTSSFPSQSLPNLLAAAPELLGPPALAPVAILLLCVFAGVGTILLLPGRMEASVRQIGGIVLGAAGLILAALLVRTAANAAGMGVYFWVFSAVALIAAVRVITHPRPVYSALYFILTVFATAGLFVLLWAEFMAVALVLIYAGAILITYVFVIMLAAEATAPAKTPATGTLAGLADYDAISREPLAASAVGFALMGVLLFVIFDRAHTGSVPAAPALAAGAYVPTGATQQLGTYLFQNQLVNLELSGLILTLAMIGAIVIARRKILTPSTPIRTDVVTSPATPVDDNPHSIPVFGTDNPRQKAYPET